MVVILVKKEEQTLDLLRLKPQTENKIAIIRLRPGPGFLTYIQPTLNPTHYKTNLPLTLQSTPTLFLLALLSSMINLQQRHLEL
jgi:hypothetical protein